MKDLEEYTLKEIVDLNNSYLYNEYVDAINSLATNRISRRVIKSMFGESINRVFQEIVTEEEQHRSHSLFSDDLILLYPNIHEQKAQRKVICSFSGGIIYPGSFYLTYRPFLENITKNKSYILKKTIKVEVGYYDLLPKNIQELEWLQHNIQLETSSSDGINYSHLNQVLGGTIPLTKLDRSTKTKVKVRNINENRNSK